MELRFEQFARMCMDGDFKCPAGVKTRAPKRRDPICAQCFEAAKQEHAKEQQRGDVPLLDELEQGHWPSFVKED